MGDRLDLPLVAEAVGAANSALTWETTGGGFNGNFYVELVIEGWWEVAAQWAFLVHVTTPLQLRSVPATETASALSAVQTGVSMAAFGGLRA